MNLAVVRVPYTHTQRELCVCNSVAGRCLKWFSHANSPAVVHWHPLPSLTLFFCKVFCECRGKNVHTEGSPNRGFFPSDSLPHLIPPARDRAITQQYFRSVADINPTMHQHLIASCCI